MVFKTIFCSEFFNIPEKANRITRRRKTQEITKCFTFYANAISRTFQQVYFRRPVETGGGVGGGGGEKEGLSSPRSLRNSILYELKEIMLKWKIVQNYKTSWNSSKFIDICNIINDLDTRDDILYPVSNELQEIFSFSLSLSLSHFFHSL